MDATRYIVAGRLIDGSGGQVRRRVFLAVSGGIITAIAPLSALPTHAAPATVTDLSHCTLLPALVDCSVSLCRSPSVDRSLRTALDRADDDARLAMLERHVLYCHSYGVLGVADHDDDAGLAARYRAGSERAIEIRSSGTPCRSRQDCDRERPGEREYLRVVLSGDIGDEDDTLPFPDRAELQHILAHRRGRTVVAVANGRQQVALALAAGCDAVEQGYCMGEANLREMARRQVVWIPCAIRARNGLDSATGDGGVACRFSQRYISPEKAAPGAEAFWKETLADQLRQLGLARKLGVRTAVGTGAGSVGILHGESMVEEMKLFLRAGYSLEETVRSASEHGARLFGMDSLGMLAAGRRATFLAVRGTVRQLPRKLSYLEGIYINGMPSSLYHKDPAGIRTTP